MVCKSIVSYFGCSSAVISYCAARGIWTWRFDVLVICNKWGVVGLKAPVFDSWDIFTSVFVYYCTRSTIFLDTSSIESFKKLSSETYLPKSSALFCYCQWTRCHSCTKDFSLMEVGKERSKIGLNGQDLHPAGPADLHSFKRL